MKQQDNIQQLKGIGEKTAKLFHKLNIDSIHDLLTYYPRDYEQLDAEVDIRDLQENKIFAIKACLVGAFQVKKVRNLVISSAFIQDGSGKIQITYFNTPYISKTVERGSYYIFRGLVKINKNGVRVMEQPKVYALSEYEEKRGTLQPVYMLTKGISNHAIQKAVKQALEVVSIDEFLPEEILAKFQFMSLHDALVSIHLPFHYDEVLEARKRLVFNEFFLFMLAVRGQKTQNEAVSNENQMLETAETIRLLERLPYKLTKAQLRVWEEVKADLGSAYTMNRLIQGDVGSGKTIIAVLALLLSVTNGYQGAMMAPTEVLAKQHYESILEMAKQFQLPICPVLLTGSLTAKEKREAYQQIESGNVNVILGTHALIQEKVVYPKLGLVITDEQHRFGVRQREALAGKGDSVHVLVMSATPIPRTLAIILYGDLHISLIDELPANRNPIKNCVVNTNYRKKAYEFMQKEITAGRQVYVVCPMVEEGELEHVENVIDYAESIRAIFPPTIEIAILHGKMKPSEKNRIMEAFHNHNIDILVSTTVIEVGINVPNATVMMIENAERFGLAQLHQLRGRVGRGDKQSYCIFVSGNDNKATMERLNILNKSNDGFQIAEEDMKLRGPGDIFGIRQSGALEFHLGDIYNDASILKNASEAVESLLKSDAELSHPENAILKRYCMENQEQQVDFRSI